MKSLVLLVSLAGVVAAAPVTVLNSSFESAMLPLNGGSGPFSQLIPGSPFGTGGTLDSWTASFDTSNAQTGAFAPSPGGINWTTAWWGGENVGYMIAFQPATISLSQTLAATLLSSTNYTLTVDIGRRSLGSAQFSYSIGLLAGSTLLGSASTLDLLRDSYGTDTFTYSSPVRNPLAGQALTIVLTSHNTTASPASWSEAFFDNVRLEARAATAPAPEPGTLAMVSAAAFAALMRLRKKR